MKIKTKRTDLLNFLKRFSTDGKLRSKSNKAPNAHYIFMKTFEGKVKIIGRDLTQKIMIRGTFDAEILEEGEFQLSDIRVFLQEFKRFGGKEITISVTKSDITLSDDVLEYGFPHGSTPVDAVIFEKMREWDNSAFIDGGIVKVTLKERVVEYEPWFEIEEINQFKSFSDMIVDDLKRDYMMISNAADGLHLTSKQEGDKRFSHIILPLLKSANYKNIEVGDIFPIISSLEGKAEFHIHVTEKGTVKLWIINNNIEWNLTYIAPSAH